MPHESTTRRPLLFTPLPTSLAERRFFFPFAPHKRVNNYIKKESPYILNALHHGCESMIWAWLFPAFSGHLRCRLFEGDTVNGQSQGSLERAVDPVPVTPEAESHFNATFLDAKLVSVEPPP